MGNRRIQIVDQINDAGALTTEDRIWAGANCVVIFDGSTGLGASSRNANWLIDVFIDEFEPLVLAGASLVDAINSGIRRIADEYQADSPATSTAIPPSAAALFLQLDDDEITVVTLGDCRCELFGDAEVREVYLDEVERLDNVVIDAALKLSESGRMSFREALQQDSIQTMLREHRFLMNTEGGYKVLAPNTKPVGVEDVQAFPAADYNRAVLMTDGFDWAVDEVVRERKSAAEILGELRAAENEDAELTKRPRFKISDDAAMVKVLFI